MRAKLREVGAWCVAPVLLSGLAACSGSARAVPEHEMVWSEEFDGSAGALPDDETWGFETFGDGSGNEELQCYTAVPGNAATDGEGHLVITALQQPGHQCVDGSTNDYTSARITTQASHTWQYGRLEVRAQVPAGVGTWPAFWALGENKPEVGWPRAGEIDVMEYVGRDPTTVKGSLHGPTDVGERWYLTREGDAGEALSGDFHTYAVEWDADGVEWELDGEPFGSVSRSEAEEQGIWVFDQPFYLLLNLAIGGTLGGPVSPDTAFPQRYLVDYVRVYQ